MYVSVSDVVCVPPCLLLLQPEELTLLLIKLRRQQAELTNIREHTLAQLMQFTLEADNPKVSPAVGGHRARARGKVPSTTRYRPDSLSRQLAFMT